MLHESVLNESVIFVLYFWSNSRYLSEHIDLWPEQDGWQFANNIFQWILLFEMFEFWMKFHWTMFKRV